MVKKENIPMLTSIRLYWAISIMLCHICLTYRADFNFGKFIFLSHGGFGVAQFVILSGFLMCMHYTDRYKEKPSLRDGIKFAANHAKKWYLLHLITMVPWMISFAILYYFRHSLISELQLIIKVILNIFLVQSWIPEQEFSVNGVAWYLSCAVAIYLVAPFVFYLNQKIKKNRLICSVFLIACIIAVFVIQDLFAVLYCHPFLRIFQFEAGVLLYNLIGDIKAKNNIFFCIMAFIFDVFAYVVLIPNVTNIVDSCAAIVLISTFYSYRDTDFLSSQCEQRMGNLSLELFLFHYPIIVIGGEGFCRFLPHNGALMIVEMIFLFVLSFVAAIVWEKYISRTKVVMKWNERISDTFDRIAG